jgi:cell division protein DivIC
MRRRYKKGTGIGVIAFVVLILCGIVTYRRIGLEERSAKDGIVIDRLQEQLDEQDERALDLDNLKAYVQTKQYIEDIAREKLGLVYKDEIIIKKEDGSEE